MIRSIALYVPQALNCHRNASVKQRLGPAGSTQAGNEVLPMSEIRNVILTCITLNRSVCWLTADPSILKLIIVCDGYGGNESVSRTVSGLELVPLTMSFVSRGRLIICAMSSDFRSNYTGTKGRICSSFMLESYSLTNTLLSCVPSGRASLTVAPGMHGTMVPRMETFLRSGSRYSTQ